MQPSSACRSLPRAFTTAPPASRKVISSNSYLIEIPRHTSKILSTAKKPQTTATALLGEFDRKGFNGAGDTYLRKVDKKDLSTCTLLIVSRGRRDRGGLGVQVSGGLGALQGGADRDSAAEGPHVPQAGAVHREGVGVQEDDRADREGHRGPLHSPPPHNQGARRERPTADGDRSVGPRAAGAD